MNKDHSTRPRSEEQGIPLAVALIGTFLLLMIVSLFSVTGLAVRGAQQAVDGVVEQLQQKTIDEVVGFLDRYLDKPFQVQRSLLAHLGESGNCPAVADYLRRYALLGDRPNYHYYGDRDGFFCGLEVDEDGRWLIRSTTKTGERGVWLGDDSGQPVTLLEQEGYEPRQRPWYQTTVDHAAPRWSSVYHFASRKGNTLGITATTPRFASDGSLLGVAATNLSLGQIGDYLNSLEPSPNSHAFIIERSGMLVASDNPPVEQRASDPKVRRLQAGESDNPLTTMALQFLLRESDSLEQIDATITGRFNQGEMEGGEGSDDLYYLVATPYSDHRGLEWLIVLAVPGSDFMGPIEHNGIVTLILIGLTILLSLLIGAIGYGRLNRQIVHFSQVACEIADGQLDRRVATGGFRELRRLAASFNLMVAQLQDLLQSLEEKVRQRTAELLTANRSLERHNLLIKNIFGRYISNEVVEQLLASPQALQLGGERRRVTILTSDLRGFTALSEQISPEDVVRVLNHYLSVMADVIDQFGGTINEFMGDGIVVFFGVPHPDENDAEQAAACAIAMQNAMPRMNRQVIEWGIPPLQMGIGINCGEVVVGNIGSEKRAKYSAVGSQMNLAFRIESYTIGGQVLISESTRSSIKAPMRLTRSRQINPKGVAEPVTIHELIAIEGASPQKLASEEEQTQAVAAPLPLTLSPIDGKQVSEQQIAAELVALGANRAEIRLIDSGSNDADTDIQPDCNLRLDLEGVELPLYARVITVDKQQKRVGIYITSGRELLDR
jgi:adenylate cyclase